MIKESDRLIHLLTANGFKPDRLFKERTDRFTEMLLELNKQMNLTAITDPAQVTIKHHFDSIYPLYKGWLPSSTRIIDIGCGAGFPSLPLKFADNTLDFTLLDSTQKRLRFVDSVINALDLENIITLHKRAEQAGKLPDYNEAYDCAVSRAVAAIDKLSAYAMPFLKKDGLFFAYKGESGKEETTAALSVIDRCGGIVQDIFSYSLPFEMGRRTMVIIRKK